MIYVSKDEIQALILANVKSTDAFKNHRFSPLSKTFTIIRALANAIFIFIQSYLVEILNAIHPHTSNEKDLLNWLIRYDLEWKQAVAAVHKIRVGSSNPITDNIEIPQGLVLSTRGGISFRILTTGILAVGTLVDTEGNYTIELFAECLATGIIGNVALGTITELDSPPEGIDIAYNLELSPEISGEEKESISSVRNRIKNKEASLNARWTPAWYVSEVESFVFVKRAIFISAKKLNSPGFVKLLLVGIANSPVSDSSIALIKDTMNSEDKNPGGVAIVLVENIEYAHVDKIINVYFKSSITVPSQDVLDNVLDEYFNSLLNGQSFKDADIRYLFLNLPDCVSVVISPEGDMTTTENSIVVPGSIILIGSVYEV
jgi:uncharacterized phage protein gp47/JayE